jgi:hypothetical protein
MTTAMSTQKRNEDTIRNRYYPELFNAGKLRVADEIIAQEFTNDSHPDWPRGPEGIKRVVQMLHTALSDLTMDIHILMTKGNQLIIWSTQSGIWKGAESLFGITEPEGTVYLQRQAHLFTFNEEGLITKHEVIRDDKETRVDQHGKIPQAA